MYAVFKRLSLLWMVFCISQMTVPIVFAQAPVSSIAAFDYPPYLAANEPKGGLVGEIVLNSYELEGHKVQLIFLPTARFVATAFNSQKSACIITTNKNLKRLLPEEQLQVLSSPPIAQIMMVLVAYQPDKILPKFDSLEDLAGRSIIAIRSSNYTASLIAAGASVHEAAIESQLPMLKLGRGELALMGDLLARRMIQKSYANETENFIILPKQVDTLSLLFVCNKQHPDGSILFERFKTGFQQLYKTGKYRKLLNTYYGPKLSKEYEKNIETLVAPWSSYQP